MSGSVTLHCNDVWESPSGDNSLIQCLTDGDRLKGQWVAFIPPVVALLFVIALLTCIPCFYCNYCTCCCCGKRVSVMKSHITRRKACLSGLTIFPLALCVLIFLVLVFYVFFSSARDVTDVVQNDLLRYLRSLKTDLIEYLTDYTQSPPKPPSLDTEALDDFMSTVNETTAIAQQLLNVVFIPSGVVALAFGILILVFVLISMLVTQHVCCAAWACLCGCITYLLAVVCAIILLAGTILTYLLLVLFGETELQYERWPGVFQWLVVPYIEEKFAFGDLQNTVRTTEEEASQNVCTGISAVCEDETGTTTTKPFVCPDALTTDSGCSSIQQVSSIISETYLKPDLVDTVCPAPEGSTDWMCTVEECATACVETTVKTVAVGLMSLSAVAVNASTALSLVQPLLQPNYLVDLMLSTIESKATSPLAMYSHGQISNLSNVSVFSIALCASFFVSAIVLLIALCVCSSSLRAYTSRCKPALPSFQGFEVQAPKQVIGLPVEKVDKACETVCEEEPAESVREETPVRREILWIPSSNNAFLVSNKTMKAYVGEEEMISRAREGGNRRLPLNPLNL